MKKHFEEIEKKANKKFERRKYTSRYYDVKIDIYAGFSEVQVKNKEKDKPKMRVDSGGMGDDAVIIETLPRKGMIIKNLEEIIEVYQEVKEMAEELEDILKKTRRRV